MSSRAAATPIRRTFAVGAEHTADCWRLGSRHDARREPLLRVETAAQALPRHQGHPVRAARSATSRRSTTSPSRSAPARRLGLVGESGCGKTTTSRLILNLEEPTERPGAARGRADPRPRGRGAARLSRQGAGGVPGPWSSLNPRMTVGRTIAEALIVNGWGDRAKIDGAGARAAARRSGCGREQAAAVSARVQRRPAPAHRARGALASRPRADRARRAGLGARRVDPRADDEPAEGHPGAATTSPTCWSRTTSPPCATWPTTRW